MKPVRTAIFGGSFNPIHNGHIRLAQHVVSEGVADEVWLLVSPHNPLKHNADLLDERIRYQLACSALKDYPHIIASDFEFHLPRPSYTWTTLCVLSEAFPKRLFSLLIGADNWMLFHQWAHFNDIIRNYSIYIYPREGNNISSSALPSNVKVLTTAPIYPFSSTNIRQAISLGEDISTMVPQSIYKQVLHHYAPAFNKSRICKP